MGAGDRQGVVERTPITTSLDGGQGLEEPGAEDLLAGANPLRAQCIVEVTAARQRFATLSPAVRVVDIGAVKAIANVAQHQPASVARQELDGCAIRECGAGAARRGDESNNGGDQPPTEAGLPTAGHPRRSSGLVPGPDGPPTAARPV